MKNTVFAGVTVLLILTVWLSAAGIVKSESSERAKEEHYAVLEQQYVEDIREYLNKTGYPDSGVKEIQYLRESRQHHLPPLLRPHCR